MAPKKIPRTSDSTEPQEIPEQQKRSVQRKETKDVPVVQQAVGPSGSQETDIFANVNEILLEGGNDTTPNFSSSSTTEESAHSPLAVAQGPYFIGITNKRGMPHDPSFNRTPIEIPASLFEGRTPMPFVEPKSESSSSASSSSDGLSSGDDVPSTRQRHRAGDRIESLSNTPLEPGQILRPPPGPMVFPSSAVEASAGSPLSSPTKQTQQTQQEDSSRRSGSTSSGDYGAMGVAEIHGTKTSPLRRSPAREGRHTERSSLLDYEDVVIMDPNAIQVTPLEPDPIEGKCTKMMKDCLKVFRKGDDNDQGGSGGTAV